jgi:hypothetical protein
MSHTSAIYGFDMQYPEGWSSIPASRAWESDDRFPADDLAYADVFLTPEQDDDQIALFVWEMPPGDGADLESFPGLIAWAERFCADFGMPSCEGSSEVAEVMCHNPCSPAILVPTPDWQVAFFEDETSKLLGPTVVRVILVARPDSFPTAARYGGSVQLLKSVLTTMDVWEVGQGPPG